MKSLLRSVPALLLLFFLLARNAAGEAALPWLTNAAQLQRLSSAEGGRGCPARVRGVSIYYDPGQNELFLQDETGGMLVRVRGHVGFELGVGQLLEAEGKTCSGSPTPELEATRLLLLGEGPLPPVCRATEAQLKAGQPDCSWVEVAGVVHTVEASRTDALLELDLETSCGPVLARIREYNLEEGKRLVDAEVVICGVLHPAKGQTGLRVPSMGDIAVTTTSPADAFSALSRDIGEVRKAALANGPKHRFKVSGAVTLQQPGRIFLQDATNGLIAASDPKTKLQPGDLVEVTGFPALTPESALKLEHASLRKVGSGPSPVPLPVSAEKVSTVAYAGTLVSVEGLVVTREHVPFPTLSLQSSNSFFSARLEDPASDFSNRLRPGARVALTGVCLPAQMQPRLTFELLLRSPADAVVIAGAPGFLSGWPGLLAVGALVIIVGCAATTWLRRHKMT